MTMKVAIFSDGHRTYYNGKKMKWAWQALIPRPVDDYGLYNPEAETRVTGRSASRHNAEKAATSYVAYQNNAHIEIVPIVEIQEPEDDEGHDSNQP